MIFLIMIFRANLLGLDNAATPFGLKAMQGLQELNAEKETASPAQIMFLTLHSAGPVLIPLSIMAQRAIYGAKDASDVFIPCLMATYAATMAGLIFVSIKQKITFPSRFFQSVYCFPDIGKLPPCFQAGTLYQRQDASHLHQSLSPYQFVECDYLQSTLANVVV